MLVKHSVSTSKTGCFLFCLSILQTSELRSHVSGRKTSPDSPQTHSAAVGAQEHHCCMGSSTQCLPEPCLASIPAGNAEYSTYSNMQVVPSATLCDTAEPQPTSAQGDRSFQLFELIKETKRKQQNASACLEMGWSSSHRAGGKHADGKLTDLCWGAAQCWR